MVGVKGFRERNTTHPTGEVDLGQERLPEVHLAWPLPVPRLAPTWHGSALRLKAEALQCTRCICVGCTCIYIYIYISASSAAMLYLCQQRGL